MVAQVPLVDFLVLGPQPYLQAYVCGNCHARYLERRNGCSRCCAAADVFSREPMADTGHVRSYTVVHRGAREPYVSVTVELDGGGWVKANLRDVDSADGVHADMEVRLATFVCDVDDEGVEAVGFGFIPTGGDERG